MYATLSYDVNAGPEPIDDVRAAMAELFADRDTCDMLSDTFICAVDDTADYLELAKKAEADRNRLSGSVSVRVHAAPCGRPAPVERQLSETSGEGDSGLVTRDDR